MQTDWDAKATDHARVVRSRAERAYMTELDELTELAQGVVDHETMIELASAWNRAARRLMVGPRLNASAWNRAARRLMVGPRLKRFPNRNRPHDVPYAANRLSWVRALATLRQATGISCRTDKNT